MPCQSKTASAALAALVVAGVAALVSLVGPSLGAAPDGARAPSAIAGTTPATAPADEASGLPAGSARASSVAPVRPTVLFLGASAALHPRGGAAKSFACRAAADLSWRCAVRSGASAVPASLRADTVVLVMGPRDDAAALGAQLDALPASLGNARTVILTPIVATASKALAARLPAILHLAVTRGADVIDPVAQRWLTAATRSTYLAADGVQPTTAGLKYLADRLANALTDLTG